MSHFADDQYNSYIYRVLKQVHPDTGISGDGLAEMNNFVRIVIQKVMDSANTLMTFSGGRKTLSSREIQSAIRLALPGELAKHAVSESVKAVTRYNSSEGGRGEARKPVSRSKRAGLQFPVTRIEHSMTELSIVNRKSEGSAVYLAATCEYITAEILELAGNAARDAKKVRITPRHIKLAILNDEELSRLFRGVVMSGGVLPNIHSKLLPKTTDEGKKVRKTKTTRKKTTTKKASTPSETQKTKSPSRTPQKKTPSKSPQKPAKKTTKSPQKPAKKAPKSRGAKKGGKK